MSNQTKRYNLFYPRQYKVNGEEKTQFVLCGVAFPLKNKDGFNIELYFPIIPKGRIVAMLNEPKEGTSQPEAPADDDDFPI
jgi:hypothetical protein